MLVFVARLFINEARFADRLVAPLLVSDTASPADVIVVMGAGVLAECTANDNSVRRVLLAARLWRERRAPRVLFTGGRGEGVTACTVAEAMARLARDIGIPEASIDVETASRSTRENAELSAPLLWRMGAARLLVVTDLLHMRRSAAAFAQLGFQVERASVPIYEGHEDNVSMLAAAAREVIAFRYYRMRGWAVPASVLREPAAAPAAARVSQHSGSDMKVAPRYPQGPVIVLGASYAAGWKLQEIGGVPVMNRGIAGQQSFELLERFERDVVAAQPRAVILWGFINDLFRAPSGGLDATLGRVRDSYLQMVSLARQHGIEPIIATEVTIRPQRSWSEGPATLAGALLGRQAYQDRINEHVLSINGWLVDLARREDLLLLDLQSTLAQAGGRRRREYAQDDGSHITPAGYAALTGYARPLLAKHLGVR